MALKKAYHSQASEHSRHYGRYEIIRLNRKHSLTSVLSGVPTDEPETAIMAAARRLDRDDFPHSQVGIQFVQVGNDAGAAAELQKLDDKLPNVRVSSFRWDDTDMLTLLL